VLLPLRGRLTTLAAMLLTLLVAGVIPGSVTHAIVFERTVLPLPPSPDHDVVLDLDVTADDDHHPLRHARARVLAMIGDRAYLAGAGETDASGRAVLHSLPRAAAWILVDADGYARASTQRILTGAPLSLHLELSRAHHVAVTVADDLGQPVSGAVVEVAGGEPLPVGAKTDDAGRATVDRLAEGPWMLAVRASGFEEVVRRVVLRKLGAFVVSVIGERGASAPLAHVQIAGSSLWPARTTDTATDGTVRIGGLAAGSYALRATSGGNVSATDLGIPLGRGEERHVTLTLLPGVFAAAKVVDGDADDAAPVPHARVTLVEGGLSPFPLEATTDETGSARLGPVARSAALLSAEADGFVPRGAIDLPPDGHTVTIVLVKAGVVEGRVVDAKGRPIDGATIEIVGSSVTGSPIDDDPRKQSFRRAEFDATLGGPRPMIASGELGVVPGPVPPIPHAFDMPMLAQGTSPGASASLQEPWVTREDGTFRVSPASPGRIRALVRHPEYLEALSDAVTLVPGGTVHVDLVLREGGSLEGRVVDDAGHPVDGATVVIAALRGSLERMTQSASDGTFAFAAVPDGVVVTASLGEDENPRVARTTAQIPEGGKATVTLTLPDARPALDVHVRDDRGYPVDAAQISVGSVDPSVPFRTTVFTDARGDTTIPGARGIALRLEVSSPGHASRVVQWSLGDPSTEITLDPSEALTGAVRESRSGAPIKGAEITLYGDVGARHSATDPDGKFKFDDVAPGAAHLRVRAPGRVTRERDVTIEDPTSHVQDLGYVELDEEGVVEGIVLDERGNPVAGARVGKDRVPTYVPATSHDTSYALTDPRGHFHLGGLEDGVVTIEAYAPDVGRGHVDGVHVMAGRTTGDVRVRLADEGGKSEEPASSGGVAVTLGELSGEPLQVVFVGVADGSEAERAGLATGDIVTEVDGVAVHSMADARARLSGPLGVDVVVTRVRGDVSESVRVPREAVRR
jgi:protocatechuate 3,4-dioxygenase beta subunit